MITNGAEVCFYRLPCGICTRTNQYCPLNTNTAGPAWPSIVTTACATHPNTFADLPKEAPDNGGETENKS